MVAAAAGVAATAIWRSPAAAVDLLDARVLALQAKVESLERALDAVQPARITNPSAASRIEEPPVESATGDAVTVLTKRLDDLASRIDALVDVVKSAAPPGDGSTGWKTKNARVVDEVARGSRDSPETTVARFFMMTTRQVYERMGMPDHRNFEGDAGQVCAWHYRTGIDGTCLVITFQTNMATRIDTLPCTRTDEELKEWITEWVRRR